MRQQNKYEPVPRLNIEWKYLQEDFHCKVCHTSQFTMAKISLFTHTIHTHLLQQELQKCFRDLFGLYIILETKRVLVLVSLEAAYYLIILNYLDIFLQLFISIYPDIHLIYLSTHKHASTHLSDYPFRHLFIYASIYTSIHPFIHLFNLFL